MKMLGVGEGTPTIKLMKYFNIKFQSTRKQVQNTSDTASLTHPTLWKDFPTSNCK